MRFARIVFGLAGVWGLLVLTPLYWMADLVGRQYPPPIAHLDFYYGFIIVALAWQVVFLVIASNPARFRPLMLAAMIEKFGYVVTLGTLYAGGRIQPAQAAVSLPDLVLGLLFVAAWVRTRPSAR